MPTATILHDEHGPYIVAHKAGRFRLRPLVYRPQPAAALGRMPLMDGVRHPVACAATTRFPPGTLVRLRLRGHRNRVADVAGAEGAWSEAAKENWFNHTATDAWMGENRSDMSEDHWRPAR